MAQKSNLLQGILDKIEQQENQINSGIFFKLEEGKDPSEIFGVLDFLKFKFQKWKLTSIYSYEGDLFAENDILIIGCSDLEEAKSILYIVYLKELIKTSQDNLNSKYPSFTSLEQDIEDKMLSKIKVGYPNNRKLEQEIRSHLEKLINE